MASDFTIYIYTSNCLFFSFKQTINDSAKSYIIQTQILPFFILNSSLALQISLIPTTRVELSRIHQWRAACRSLRRRIRSRRGDRNPRVFSLTQKLLYCLHFSLALLGYTLPAGLSLSILLLSSMDSLLCFYLFFLVKGLIILLLFFLFLFLMTLSLSFQFVARYRKQEAAGKFVEEEL